jgi:hypothetical protein
MSSAAAKQKSYRERVRRGRVMFQIEADPVAVGEAVTRNGFLQIPNASHAKMGLAVAKTRAMSALPPKADICAAKGHVRDGPKADFSINRLPKMSGRVFGQERENETRDLVVLLIQSEMASVEKMDFGVRQIALESLCPRSNKRRIIPTPGHQSRRHAR